MATPSKTTVVSKLERSRLDAQAVQREAMGKDVDIKSLKVYLKSKIKFDAVEMITGATLARSITGASTVEIELQDHLRSLLRSGLLNSKLDIEIDGLWFRLVGVKKAGDTFTLTFEQREIAVLRTYSKFKIANRTRATRAEFINNLIREVKEFRIPTVIPEKRKVQPIERASDEPTQFEVITEKTPGIPEETGRPESSASVFGEYIKSRDPLASVKFIPGVTDFPTAQRLASGALTVKGVRPTNEQIQNANTILSVGKSMGAVRKVLVASIMTAIQESTLRNLPGGDRDSAGLFQQRGNGAWGTYEDRTDPATAARMFFQKAMKVHASDPTRPYWDLAQTVQVSAFPEAYAQWRTEAERFVTAYGVPGGDTESSAAEANSMMEDFSASGDFFFYRGEIADGGKTRKPENSWDCIQRLADEVNWRAFFVAGTFYYLAEDDLFKQKPLMTIGEFSEGVEGLDGDYTLNSKSATLDLTARVGRWTAPPGSVVVVKDMGPWNGRWLVTEYSRDLFDARASITLSKPRPRLPEPFEQMLVDETGWATPKINAGQDQTFESSAAGYLNPLPTSTDFNRSEFMVPDAEGAPDSLGNRYHAAKDWFAPSGSPVVAPINGTVVEVKQSRGNSGQIYGGVVKFQQANGYVWVFRHIDPVQSLAEGATVDAGTRLATVTNWTDNPKSSHAHIEIWRTLSGGYNFENMVDPVKFLKGSAA